MPDQKDGQKSPLRENRSAVLRGKELHWPGAPLLALLLEAGHTRGLSIRELAEKHLGITHSHFLLLRKGKRSIPKLGDDTMDKIAEFLGLPRVMVMLAAGQLKPEHFYQQPQMMNQYVERALKFIQTDPEFGAPDAAGAVYSEP